MIKPVINQLLNIKYHLEYKETFKDVKLFCMFIGYPRSGHSLIGSLLDAYPNAIIAHEYHTLKALERSINTTRLFYETLALSKRQGQEGRLQKTYSYKIEDLYQGNIQSYR